jgi:Fe-S cluster assembly protein SufD
MAHALDAYLAEWERARPRWQHNGHNGLARLREEALQRFMSRGLPTTREEEWRFTSVAPIAERTFALARPSAAEVSADDIAPLRLPIAPAVELVFVNGRHVPALSRVGALPTGSRVENLADALATASDQIEPHLARTPPVEQQPFVALNTAFLDDGAWIQVAAGAILQEPIHLLFLSTGGIDDRPLMSHPRILAILGENSQASVIETFAGTNGAQYFTNALTDIVVGDNAVLDHYKLQYDSPEAFHVGAIHVRTERSATYRSHSISLGGALVRNDVTAVMNGEGAECTLNGLYAVDAQRLVDNHTTIDHARPHCGSREVYKGILADHARGVFNGKIIVRPDAQKTDAKQTNRALLLSEDAQINTKPQLEIFANDVKCTHGAAVGQLDEEALFYLRSRGLGDASARRMLIHAFAADVLNRLPLESVRMRVEERLQQQLARSLPAAA